jgi:hypothetical protein
MKVIRTMAAKDTDTTTTPAVTEMQHFPTENLSNRTHSLLCVR